jgi:hypothetical protein
LFHLHAEYSIDHRYGNGRITEPGQDPARVKVLVPRASAGLESLAFIREFK